MEKTCSVDGKWSQWRNWAEKPCECQGQGEFNLQSTTRSCDAPSLEGNGNHCEGMHHRTRICPKSQNSCIKNCDSKNHISTESMSENICTNLFRKAHPRTVCGKLAVTCSDLLETNCTSLRKSDHFSIEKLCKISVDCLCAPGYLIQNGECVLPGQCSCQFRENFVKNGNSIGKSDRNGCEECRCNPDFNKHGNSVPSVTCTYHNDPSKCSPTNCGLSPWTAWSNCDKTCLNLDSKQAALSHRFRNKNSPPASFNGQPCLGDVHETTARRKK